MTDVRPITQVELAELAGVTKQAVSKAVKVGGPLYEAKVGRRIDRDHPAVAKYVKSHGRTTTSLKKKAKNPAKTKTANYPRGAKKEIKKKETPPPSPENMEAIGHMTVAEITDRWGTTLGFKDWLDARKTQEDIHFKELKNRETKGELIDRELVRVHVFGAMEASHSRLLSDTPKTIARSLAAKIKSGASIEECEAAVRDAISSQLKPAIAKARKALRR